MTEVMLFDCHCDTISRIHEYGQELFKNNYHMDLNRASAFKRYAQVFALWADAEKTYNNNNFDDIYNTAVKEFKKNQDKIYFCKNSSDMIKAFEEGKSAAFLSVEGAELIGGPQNLKKVYDLGVRIINITWNYKNIYGSGAVSDNSAGLTGEGRKFAQDAESLGIILDVSHLSEKGFYDLYECTKMPFIASHSNCSEICGVLRNLSDDQLRVIIERGGICGLNLYSNFVSKTGRSSLDDVVEHAYHILGLNGENIITIGSDFDGCDSLPDGVPDITGLFELYDCFLKHNFNETLVKKIFFGNMYNFICKVL